MLVATLTKTKIIINIYTLYSVFKIETLHLFVKTSYNIH